MNDEEFTAELNTLRPQVAAYARTLCREAEAAEDLAQDALVKAWQYRANVHTNLAAWLRRVVHSAFVDTCRKSPKHVPLDAIPPDSEILRDTFDVVKLAENRDAIRRALVTKGKGYKECVEFLALGDTTDEYADRMGINRQTLKVRIHRMRRRFAEAGLL